MPRSAKRTSASRWAVSERSQRSPTDQALSGMALGLIPAASTTRFAASRAGPIGVTQVRRRVDEIAAFHLLLTVDEIAALHHQLEHVTESLAPGLGRPLSASVSKRDTG